MLDIIILTLFPQHMGDFFLKGIFKRAHENKLFTFRAIDLRDFTQDKYRSVDDYPVGHRQGMVLKADIIERAILSIEHWADYQLLYTCPKGPVITQESINGFLKASFRGLIVLCGYYEGVDERIFSVFPFQRFSIGEFVLSSGDLPALVLTEALIRQIPGVLGNTSSLKDDSIISGLLEYPQYTSPQTWHEISVPEILYSGHHKNIETWQKKQAFALTLKEKPHLLIDYPLDANDKKQLTDLLR
jgi:tRNA (guanine37-N1)-methyltransferase